MRGRLPALATAALRVGLVVYALAGVIWAYAPMLDNYFVCDDFAYLAVGRRLLDEPRLALSQEPIYAMYVGADRRPLGNVLWAGLAALFGERPQAYYALMLALHLANVALLGWVLWRWRRDPLWALLAAALFATFYGLRNGVMWMSNLNESLLLTVGMVAFHSVRARALGRASALVAGGLVLAGCLVKESIAPLLGVLMLADRALLGDDPPLPWRRVLLRWAPVLVLFGVYAFLRLGARRAGYYGDFGPGPHVPGNWAALVTYAFTSELLPLYFERVLRAPELVGLVTGAWTAVMLWLALRAAPTVRILASWVLLQALVFSLSEATTPFHVPSRYLYATSAPAMALVALGVVELARRGRAGALAAGLLGVALLGLSLLGLQRVRSDERLHWQVASDTLRRDFALLDAAELPAGAMIDLIITPAETPTGGAWWGWEGYPVVCEKPIRLRRLVSIEEATPVPGPRAVFVYEKGVGPVRAEALR